MVTHLLGSLLLILFAASPLLAEPPLDPEATKLLVGSWIVSHDQLPILTKDGAITFKSDGTFALQGVFRIADSDRPVHLQGKWSVKDGILIEETTGTSDAQLVPVGWTTRDTVLAVTDKEYRFRTVDKAEYTYHRK